MEEVPQNGLILYTLAMRFLKALKAGWMRFAHALGRVNTILILTVFYAVILLPFGIISRSIRVVRDAKERETYWIHKEPQTPTLESLRNPF